MSDTLLSAGSLEIERLELVTCIDEVLDLRGFSPSFTIFEDLYSPYLHGKLVVIDAAALFNNLPIVGEEKLRVKFYSSSYGDDDPFNYIEREFNVVSIKNYQVINDYTVSYILEFVSTEALRNIQTKISRAWQDKRYSEVVTSLMTGNFDLDSKVKGLGFPEEDYSSRVERKTSKFLTNQYIENHYQRKDDYNNVELFVEKTKYTEPFYSTCYDTPFNIIRKIARKSIRDCPGFPETSPITNFLFFENKRGFQYVSIDSLIETKQNIGKFVYGERTKNTGSNIGRYINLSSVRSIQIPKTFDLYKSIASGAYASRLFSYDLRTGANREIIFDYLEDYQDRLTMNKEQGSEANNFPPFFLDENNQNERTRRYDSKHFNQPLNYGETNIYTGAYSQSRNTEFVDLEEILQRKHSHLALMDIHKLIIEVAGDSRHKVGDMVEFELREMNPETEREQLSKYFSGYYMITSIKHEVSAGDYSMIIELSKDSVAKKIGKVD